MTTTVRKVNLIAHVAASVGWLGAVLVFLALSIVGLRGGDAATVRSAYVAMNLAGELVIVPLSFLALATGLVLALGTEWGLFRHYWVLVKFALTLGATALLLLHQFTAVAEAARLVSVEPAVSGGCVGALGVQLVVDASLAVVVLVVATVLSILKPGGKVMWRRPSVRVWILVIVVFLSLVVLHHLVGGGMRHAP